MKSQFLAAVGVSLMTLALPSEAATIFDITGTGQACTGAPDVVGAVCTSTSFTGVVTIDLDPSIAPQISSGGDSAVYSGGALVATFSLFWEGGSYASAHVPAPETDFSTGGAVWDNAGNPGYDGVNISWYSGQYLRDQTGSYWSNLLNYAHLVRSSDTSWLSDLTFPETLGLAPGPDAVNWIRYVVYSADCAPDAQSTPTCVYVGYYGDVYLDSMVARTSVPEPGTLALLGLGLAGLGLIRRRKV